MKAALLGHGTIGVGVDRIVRDLPDIDIVRVCALETDEEIQDRHTFKADDIINDPEIDTVVEVMGGIHPAWEFLSAAMKAGKNVVTANKAVVAAYYRELLQLSAENHVAFRCTAAVGGGIPWLVGLAREKKADRVTRIGGIMNGTTNYILSRMNGDGSSFDEALAEAQKLGYAERDPSADIDGADVRRKLAISAGVAFDCFVDEAKVPTAGIRFVQTEDLAEAASEGRVLKLAGFSEKLENGLSALVAPFFVPEEELLASVPGNVNMLSLTADYSGELSFAGQGAGRYPTAKNVVLDLIDIVNGAEGYYTAAEVPEAVIDNSGFVCRWYFRTAEGAGVPAELTESLRDGKVFTKEISAEEAFGLYEKLREKDPAVFMAGIL